MRNIPTRAKIKEKKRVCRSNLRETLNIVLNWTEEKRAKEECLVPAHQVIFMSVFPENFQPIDQIQDLTIYSHEGRLASTLERVFERTQKITRESHTRINYKSRNTLLVSSKRNEIEEREMRLLVKFESAFYNLSGLLENLPEGIKRNLCYLIKDREDHKCQLCVSKISEGSNNEMESTHMIKEEDSASEASLNIIA
ncbi:hypothetical protein Ahy_A06g025874 [Arachis hypogaea]|uniref:Uncharacterized protein n=1 Tax=Arachis hypogaea TaxID=3818 RepID=A0A445CIY0_ARAHY|nr:hypothetical protein Ahy_A06g025874 [Arachis hypogaea]